MVCQLLTRSQKGLYQHVIQYTCYPKWPQKGSLYVIQSQTLSCCLGKLGWLIKLVC